MERRAFLKTGVATGAAVAAATMASRAAAEGSEPMTQFKLKYAPHDGMFKHHAGEDVVEQIKFANDMGFMAWEDNGMKGRPVEQQIAIAETMAQRGMTMGVHVAYGDFDNPTMTGNRMDVTQGKRDKEAVRAMLEKACHESVEVAKRTHGKWCTVVPGAEDPSLSPEFQMANVIEHLRFCAGIFEEGGIIMVLEPLNHRDHPGLYLKRIPQAYAICKAVNSPACKILDDLYHQQITEGNLIPNMDAAWEEIAYFQIGDNPGRHEPTTGEINYQNVFKHIHARGFDGVMGMEHGWTGTKEGEMALIKAYQYCDSFDV